MDTPRDSLRVTRWLDVLGWLDDMRRNGKIRSVGATNFDAAHVATIGDAGIGPQLAAGGEPAAVAGEGRHQTGADTRTAEHARSQQTVKTARLGKGQTTDDGHA